MRLWTIQNIKFWEILQDKGEIVSDDKLVYEGFSFNFEDGVAIDANWKFAYDWISEQMSKTIEVPPKNARYPIWAWYQWYGPQKMPDLRIYKSSILKNETWVRIEFEIDEKDIMLSDVDKWTEVLMGNLVGDEEEQEIFDKKLEKEIGTSYISITSPRMIPSLKKEMMDSWYKVFDLNRSQGEQDWYGEMKYQQIQATFWKLKLSQVKKVKIFQGNKKER